MEAMDTAESALESEVEDKLLEAEPLEGKALKKPRLEGLLKGLIFK